MGLCKCPKRRATNLFCFEHRVNVCEYCIVDDVHESCVVQTYLSWLTDSDYDPKCPLCSEPLNLKETIRLKCLHNFHWLCLSARIGSLPENSQQSAYKCPSCLDTIFPATNQTSPVIERLKQKLSAVNWGRIGLGLDAKPGLDVVTESASNSPATRKTFSAVDMNFEGNTRIDNRNSVRSKIQTSESSRPLLQNDTDLSDTKYVKRQSGMRFRVGRLPKTIKRIGLVLLLLLTFYFLLLAFGRDSSNSYSNQFDPHANPNIRVE
ncbi:Zinc finger protein-like 1-like protein [Aphelenchoides bicaudatus]|nr:Zinc finger protein-like 1-like protein [Aphelenchoides bicaudatus]